MGKWTKADSDSVCAECGEGMEEGEDAYLQGDDLYCEGCHDDMCDDEAGMWEDEDEHLIDGVGFADPGGVSALRAETPDNPRDCDCPTCGAENVLTRIDRQRGYQCDSCANKAEGGYGYGEY